MQSGMGDTIYALSSGPGRSGVGVVRLSGTGVRQALETMIGMVPPARQAVLKAIRDRNGLLIDHGIVLYFKAPHSFTGEDCAEFQVHGSRAVIAALYEALSQLPDFRLAEAGEFTRRAFVNGRIDLTAAEGLSDLIAAETEEQRRAALAQASGRLRAKYDDWAARLTHARALVEAELDFSDEEDIPGSVSTRIWSDMAVLREEIAQHLKEARSGEIIRDGFTVVLAGPVNAGKSSLLNAIARRDVAIVSEEAGTTRDLVSVDLDLEGYLVRLVDTAGLRETSGAVEQEGIRRAISAITSADLVLQLIPADDPSWRRGAGPERDHRVIEPQKAVIRLLSKADLVAENMLARYRDQSGADICLSVHSGRGIGELIRRIGESVSAHVHADLDIAPTRERHRSLLISASQQLDNALAGGDLPLEIRTEYLRAAASHLGRITGRVDVEDLLDVIFAEFCVGK